MSADQRQESLIRSAEVMTIFHNNGENSIIGLDLQVLIRPDSISGTIVDFIMRDNFARQLDVTYVSVAAMHANRITVNCNSHLPSVTSGNKSNPLSSELAMWYLRTGLLIPTL